MKLHIPAWSSWCALFLSQTGPRHMRLQSDVPMAAAPPAVCAACKLSMFLSERPHPVNILLKVASVAAKRAGACQACLTQQIHRAGCQSQAAQPESRAGTAAGAGAEGAAGRSPWLSAAPSGPSRHRRPQGCAGSHTNHSKAGDRLCRPQEWMGI